MNKIPPEIQDEINRRGLSAVLDDIYHRECIGRDEMLYWKSIRFLLQDRIQAPIDELSDVAERAFRDGTND